MENTGFIVDIEKMDLANFKLEFNCESIYRYFDNSI